MTRCRVAIGLFLVHFVPAVKVKPVPVVCAPGYDQDLMTYSTADMYRVQCMPGDVDGINYSPAPVMLCIHISEGENGRAFLKTS